MSEQHPYRCNIPPVPEGGSRPLWSVMIPTYNCAKYLRKTLASVLAQDPGPDVMQIEVVDDRSTRDDPAAVVEELGHGRVNFYQQPENRGHIRNFETCLKRSQGKLIHLLHGDDYVRGGFYSKMQQAFEAKPEIGAAFCRHFLVNEHEDWNTISALEQPESGVLSNCLERIVVKLPIQTPSIVVRRDVYESLGGFDSRLTCGEDWEMWARISAHYPMWYQVEPLAVYRMSSASHTGRSVRTGQNVRDMLKVIEIIQPYLPEAIAGKLSSKAREHSAIWALSLANHMIDAGNTAAAITQIREAFKCSNSLKVIRKSVLPILRIGKRWNWQTLRADL